MVNIIVEIHNSMSDCQTPNLPFQLTMAERGHLYIIVWASISINQISATKQSLNGKTLRMATDHWEPWSLVPEVSGSASYSGVSWKILEYLQDSLNFSVEIKRSPDGSWGSPDESGVWGGMVGMVKRNEVDFGLGKKFSLPAAKHVYKLKLDL